MTPLSQALASRIAHDWREVFDADQRAALADIVRTAFVDTAACILAGRPEPATALALQWAQGRAGSDRAASILFGDTRLPPPLAALVNGVAGHALDYDDVGLAGHPSVVLVPALLAEHERSGVRGFELVQAYAKGYAAWGELQRRLKTSLHARGWHPTAVLGTVGAAAALASARGLDAASTAHALGIAASLAAGVIANFGSMTKPLQVGRAAEAAFTAVDLAALGLDASPDALDGRAGLLAALVGREQVELGGGVAEDFEATLLRQPPGIKKYPICYAAHRVVDGVLDLARAQQVVPEDVEAVDATISTTTAGVLRHHEPATLSEARFSLEFVVAVALVHGRVGVREVSEEALRDERVRSLMRRVRTHTTDTSCPLEPSFAFADEVRLTLRDGRQLASGPIRFARGHAELPLEPGQLEEKLLGCAEESVARSVIARLDRALTD